jgi:hypothetical protein
LHIEEKTKSCRQNTATKILTKKIQPYTKLAEASVSTHLSKNVEDFLFATESESPLSLRSRFDAERIQLLSPIKIVDGTYLE